jgi:hypothetical protein
MSAFDPKRTFAGPTSDPPVVLGSNGINPVFTLGRHETARVHETDAEQQDWVAAFVEATLASISISNIGGALATMSERRLTLRN